MFLHLHFNQRTELCTLESLLLEPSLTGVSVIDISYIPTSPHSIFTWFIFLGKLCATTSAPEFQLRLICAWVPIFHFVTSIKLKCLALLQDYIPSTWSVNCSLCHAVNAGDAITADGYVISFTESIINTIPIVALDSSDTKVSTWGFQSCLHPACDIDPIIDNLQLSNPSQYIDPKSPSVVTMMHSSDMSAVERMNSSNCILDPSYPAMEPSPVEYINCIFGRRFGVANVDKVPYTARKLSNCELIQ